MARSKVLGAGTAGVGSITQTGLKGRATPVMSRDVNARIDPVVIYDVRMALVRFVVVRAVLSRDARLESNAGGWLQGGINGGATIYAPPLMQGGGWV